MTAKLMFVHALSPLHAGTGQGVGVIDLPIAREKATGLPFLPGSSLKGPLRDLCEDGSTCTSVFGPDSLNAAEQAGAAQFSDQRLLLLPVRSLNGTFAWVTSPFILSRFKRDLEASGVAEVPSVPQPANEELCVVHASDCALKLQNGEIVLEELDLKVSAEGQADNWADKLAAWVFGNDPTWQAMLKQRICIVHDNVLNFLLQTATEITARIKLKDDTKTVEDGGLWYEEALPTETILAGLVVATPVDKTNMSVEEIHAQISGLLAKPIQFGGKATVGRGLCRVQMV